MIQSDMPVQRSAAHASTVVLDRTVSTWVLDGPCAKFRGFHRRTPAP